MPPSLKASHTTPKILDDSRTTSGFLVRQGQRPQVGTRRVRAFDLFGTGLMGTVPSLVGT